MSFAAFCWVLVAVTFWWYIVIRLWEASQ